jgi:hypothetical protein
LDTSIRSVVAVGRWKSVIRSATGSPADRLKARFVLRQQRLGGLRNALPNRPSLADLARAAGVKSSSTVDNWLKGKKYPADIDAFVVVVARIKLAADAVGREDGSALLDGAVWREQYVQVQNALQAMGRQVEDGRRAADQLAAAEARGRRDALVDQPRPVHAWRAGELGVHRAISGPQPSVSGFVLPPYVTRPHDAELCTHVQAAVAGDGGSCFWSGQGRVRARPVPQSMHCSPSMRWPSGR